jgi:hypothetical protein
MGSVAQNHATPLRIAATPLRIFSKNYMRDHVRELRTPRKDGKYLKTV